jgi:predicted AAA+ superfamily ATPase
MYPRFYKSLKNQSFFLFGPRGTGKSTWLRAQYTHAHFIDLLDTETYRYLLSDPHRLEGLIPQGQKVVVIDEVQKVPEILNEVHRLIELKKIVFILTGSSARKLKRQGVNLLAGRALQKTYHPLTCWELGKDFSLEKALKFGLLPSAVVSDTPNDFLAAYVNTYLREEVQAEGLVRNLSAYSRFLEMASFSQGSPLTMSSIASDVGVDAKVIASYFDVTEDLLLSVRVPVFSKKAKRRLKSHPKFFYFDCGVYRKLRPRGPLDSEAEIDGPALETLFLQHFRALGEFANWDQKIYYWKTANNIEVDFVSYGEEGLFAFEIKGTSVLRQDDLGGLRLFKQDYPMAKCFLLNFDQNDKVIDDIHILPFERGMKELPQLMGANVNFPID